MWADYLENVGASTSRNPMGHHDMLKGYFYRLSSEVSAKFYRNIPHIQGDSSLQSVLLLVTQLSFLLVHRT
jgi:hypothetical protein